MKMVNRVVQVSYHRNGVGGAGFHAVVFEHTVESCRICGGGWGWTSNDITFSCENQHAGPPKSETCRMLGIVFDERAHVAVLDIAKLADPEVGVAFGDSSEGNSWRGDRFEDELREAIQENHSDGSVRVGPFAIPTKRRRAP